MKTLIKGWFAMFGMTTAMLLIALSYFAKEADFFTQILPGSIAIGFMGASLGIIMALALLRLTKP